eukprot:scaffold556_cov58-Cyclotella_meneghiniana.AAC.15
MAERFGVRSVVGSKFTERGLSLAWLKSEVHAVRDAVATSLVNGRLKHGPQWPFNYPCLNKFNHFEVTSFYDLVTLGDTITTVLLVTNPRGRTSDF